MKKNEKKNNYSQSLPIINEVTLKYRLDLLKISNLKKNIINDDKAKPIINKDNLFERLSACKGLNLDKDVIQSRKNSLKINVKSLVEKVNETICEVEVNVLKHNERNNEMLKKIEIIENTKGERKKNKFISMSNINNCDMSPLERIKFLIEKADEKVYYIMKQKQEIIGNKLKYVKYSKTLDNGTSPKVSKNLNFSDKNLDLDRIKNLENMRKYSKKDKTSDFPLINQQILCYTPHNDNLSSLNQSKSSAISNHDHNDIDELMINDCKLLIKKYVLPKVNNEMQNSSFIAKNNIKLDKNNKILLNTL